jgi:hypothetical protein
MKCLKRGIQIFLFIFLNLSITGSIFIVYGSGSSQSFSFTITSDMHSYTNPGQFPAVLDAITSTGGPGVFMIVSGDMSPFPWNVDAAIDEEFGSDFDWYPIIGNHELDDPSYVDWVRNEYSNLQYIVNSGPADCETTTYSFDYGEAHFVALNVYYNGISDTGTDGDIVPALYNWLEADLAATDKKWIIVIGHEPAYPQPDADWGDSRHVGDSLDKYPVNRDRFWALLDSYDVTAYLVGHTHRYSRYIKDGVWQVNEAQAQGTGQYDTFIRVTVENRQVTFETYRSLLTGTFSMTDSWSIYAHELSAGWNMVSFPCLTSDSSFSNLLGDLPFYQIYIWDGLKYVSPIEAEPGLGYWLWVPDDTILTVADGEPVESFELDLPLGWSMIGSIFPCTVDAEQVFPSFYQLYTWNGLRYVSSTIIESGMGYWAFVPAETHIVVDESCAYLDDVIFDSDFEMGNLINVQFQNGDASGYRYYKAELNYSLQDFDDKHWWFYFSMENVQGKTVEVELRNLAPNDFDSPGERRWPNTEPVYSYDNVNWERVPLSDVQCGDRNTLNYRITIRPIQYKVWLAPIFPYTISMENDLFSAYTSDYLDVTTLGSTPLGLDLQVATITDPSVADEGKVKVYIIAQQHSGETVSSFVADGMIRFLLDGFDPVADEVRKNFIFKIIPVVNVEGVMHGISRYTPFRSGTQYDLNREWDEPILEMQPEVEMIFSDIQNWGPDAFLDLHGDSVVEYCYLYNDGLSDDEMTSFLDNIAHYWPEGHSRGSTIYSVAQVRSRLGVHPGALLEHPRNRRASTAEHPEEQYPLTIDDFQGFGEGIICGINDYFSVATVSLEAVDPDITSPSGDYRWMDVADQVYGVEYCDSYNYSQASVDVTYYTIGTTLRGTLTASNLKPNFAYQLKLAGSPGTDDNERLGLVGRWWEEEWLGADWSDGWNLNDKGDGSSPNPNDVTYFERRDQLDISSPTGYHYRYTGYLLFDYFITDGNGDTVLEFETGNCYHVLWKTSQQSRTDNDGVLKSITFDPDPLEVAYDADYPVNTVEIFGEWERLPMGEVQLTLGEYNCKIFLTEESFHGSDPLEGNWAGAMAADISFNIIN